jgi:hypothetical protein
MPVPGTDGEKKCLKNLQETALFRGKNRKNAWFLEKMNLQMPLKKWSIVGVNRSNPASKGCKWGVNDGKS